MCGRVSAAELIRFGRAVNNIGKLSFNMNQKLNNEPTPHLRLSKSNFIHFILE